MVSVTALWLPILVAAVLVFIVSSVLHMLIPIHKGDYKKLPGEEQLRAAMRSAGVAPGHYAIPHASSMQEMGSEEMTAKLSEGPVGFLTVMPNGPMAIGKSLAQWFAYSLLIGLFTAYICGLALAPGAAYMEVFRLAGTVAILGYALSSVPESIWKGLSWTVTAKFAFDGLLYGLVTAGAFGWLWPAA